MSSSSLSALILSALKRRQGLTDMSNRHSLEPPKSSSSRLSKDDRSVKERVDILITRLDRTKDILLHECSKGDRFGNLALGTLEKTLKELVPAIKLIEQSSDIKEESQQSPVHPISKEQPVTSKERKEEEEDIAPSRDLRNGRGTHEQREDEASCHTRPDRLAKSDSIRVVDNEISPPLSRSHSSTTKRDDPLPPKTTTSLILKIFPPLESSPVNPTLLIDKPILLPLFLPPLVLFQFLVPLHASRRTLPFIERRRMYPRQGPRFRNSSIEQRTPFHLRSTSRKNLN